MTTFDSRVTQRGRQFEVRALYVRKIKKKILDRYIIHRPLMNGGGGGGVIISLIDKEEY